MFHGVEGGKGQRGQEVRESSYVSESICDL